MRVRWNLEPADPGVHGADPAPTVVPHRRRRVTAFLLSPLYVAALLAAAWVGFGLGRWSEARTINLGSIRNQLAVEAVAWREGDAGLYASTLDPEAPSRWREQQVATFRARAPRSLLIEARSIDLVAPGAAQVVVAITSGTSRLDEERTYRLHGQTWYQAASNLLPGPSDE
jgi:hypothetical protein